jgi:hypothetical protein
MIELQLQQVSHERRNGSQCEYIKPNVTESCLLKDGSEIVGVYLSDVKRHDEKLVKIMSVANAEFRSERVPKTLMERADVLQAIKAGMSRAEAQRIGTAQYSTILGSVPPNPVMRRNYRNRSSVHLKKNAKTFVKAMLMATERLDALMAEYLPSLHDEHVKAIAEIDEQWRFGRLFTSSISNFNIAAPFHRDRANVRQTLNAIYTMRENSVGGCLYVPDYDACFEMPSHSLLFYPAWRNTHAVTPIQTTHDSGYRNSLVWYALQAFVGDEHDNEKRRQA